MLPDLIYISTDSRQMQGGGVFVAINGHNCDGRNFIDDAINKGARYIVLEGPKLAHHREGIHYEYVDNVRLTLSKLAKRKYPQKPAHVIMVTGTNGKSSVAHFYNQIITFMGERAASVGTIGVYVGMQQYIEETLTTPDALSLHALMTELYEQGISYAAVEASSHGLDQYRLHDLQPTAAAFTNLTADHLDYHQSFDDYFAAKKKLFTEVLPVGATAVLNADIAQYKELELCCQQRGQKIITYGQNAKEIKLLSKDANNITLQVFGKEYNLLFPLLGDFQIANALCALGLALACGANASIAVKALSEFHSAPGRLEQVATFNGAKIVIDYAHTGDALINVLTTLRKECSVGNLHLVVGSGGDRDPRRRVELAQAAQRYADYVIITDDNPRTEDPSLIRQEMLRHCPKGWEIAGRAVAIKEAISRLQAGDILAIVGKGHENYQIIGDNKIYFSDKEEILQECDCIIN